MKIAINGIGVAGPTLAYWLRHYGHEVTLYEKSPVLRTGGYVIDFWGLGYEVAEKMGIIPEILKKGYEMQSLDMVDAKGNKKVTLSIEPIRQIVKGRLSSIARGDLAAIIARACDGIPMHFDLSVIGYEEVRDGITIELSNGSKEKYDLLIGADGLHSKIRDLIYGENLKVEFPVGCYVAAFHIRNYPHRDELKYLSHTAKGRQVARLSLRDDQSVVLFIARAELFSSEPPKAEQKSEIRRVFGDMQWETPELLNYLDKSDELYFDRVSQIRVPSWRKGRVALLGDAAACASLLAGEGTGLAMAEAYVLAREIHRSQGDYTQAFENYEKQLRPFVEKKQRAALNMLGFFVPKSNFGIKIRDSLSNLANIPFLSKLIAGPSLKDSFKLPKD